MPRILAIASLSLASIAVSATAADARPHHGRGHHHDVVRRQATAAPTAKLVRSSARAARSAPVVVYLNRDGGVIGGGDDDAENDRSWLVPGRSATVPAWSGGDARWGQVMKCVKDRFSAFNVEITDQRPTQSGYVMAMVGGAPKLLGMGTEVSGIAPYTGEVERNAIVFVFSENVENDVETTCVDTLHEVGHALGLDHEYLCEDPMSYLWDCEAPKVFQNVDVPCGEDEARACENGPTQNSWQTLARNVGLRNESNVPAQVPAPPAADDSADDGSDDGSDDGADDPADDASTDDASTDDGADDTADDTADEPVNPYGHGHHHHMAIEMRGPSGAIDGNQTIAITVRAHDAREAILGWVSPTGNMALSCGSIPDDAPARCSRRGDTFTFELDVGVGWRYFAAKVIDRGGRSLTTDFQQVFLRGEAE
ncbi:MAG: hypothetical protein K8W52_24695 [Deltaproteobacteria bacterium]|nr:hypothetical protein [Deltaproteobacteria bacterium]